MKKHFNLTAELDLGFSELERAQKILSDLLSKVEKNFSFIKELEEIKNRLEQANYRIDKAIDIHNHK